MSTKMTAREYFSKILPKAGTFLAERVEREVPDKGRFTPVSVSFDLFLTPGTVVLLAEPSANGPENARRLRLGAHRPDPDRFHAYYIVKDSKEGIVAWLKDPQNIPQLEQWIRQLAEALEEDE